MHRRTLLGAIPPSLVAATDVSSGASGGRPRGVDGRDGIGRTRDGQVIEVADADTVTVRFEDGTKEEIRLLGVDCPELMTSRGYERPEEWEGLAYEDDRTLVQLQFASTCALHAPGETQLTDDSIVAVRSEPTARIEDTDDEGPVVDYDGSVPLVAVSGRVVGFGAIMVDGSENFPADNEEFLLNVWDELVGSGTVLWDEGHDQFFDTNEVTAFPTYAEDHGYSVQGTTSLVDDLPDADAVVVTSPSNGFSTEELDALESFVDDGGAVFLHSQSDYNDFDGTQIHNEIAEALDLDFRFSDNQVFDDTNNGGESFVPVTRNYTDSFPEFLKGRAGIDGVPVKTSEALTATAEASTSFTTDRLLEESVTVTFDGDEPTRDSFDRLLGYVAYEDSDGEMRLFNRELLTKGYARVYGSGFARHREFWLTEADARDDGRGVWATSDIGGAPSYRNRPVESVFFPTPASVRRADGELPRDRAPVRAMSTATQNGSPDVSYDVGIPLVGVDPDARVAAVGAPVIDESYEQVEGFSVDTSVYENYVLLTNLIGGLADASGDVLIDGGHGQFAADHAVSSEEAVYYQRFLEGQGIGLEQRNELTEETLADGRALVVTAPQSSFTEAERDAVRAFRDDGGAVVLLGSGALSPERSRSLNELSAALSSDLRFNLDTVVDADHRLAEDPAVFETQSFATPYGGMFEAFDGEASFPARASGDGSSGDGTSSATTPGTGTPGAVPSDSSMSVEDLWLPGAVAAGGVASVLAVLGLWGRDASDDVEDPTGGDARADGGTAVAERNGGDGE